MSDVSATTFGIPLELRKRFRRVCPIWAKHILDDSRSDTGFSITEFCGSDGRPWNINHSNSCVVGEAHGRKMSYRLGCVCAGGCGKCMAFAKYLMEIYHRNWPVVLKDFLDHYEKEHAMEVPA